MTRNISFYIAFFSVLLTFSCNKKNPDFVSDYHTLIPCKVIGDKKGGYFEVKVKNTEMVLKDDIIVPFDSIDIFEIYPIRLKFYQDSISDKIFGDVKFDMDTTLATYMLDSNYIYSSFVYKYPADTITLEDITLNKDKLSFNIKIDRYHNIDTYLSFIDLKNNMLYIDTLLFQNIHTNLNPLFVNDTNGFYSYLTKDSLDYDSVKIVFYQNQIDDLTHKMGIDTTKKLNNSIVYLKISKFIKESKEH